MAPSSAHIIPLLLSLPISIIPPRLSFSLQYHTLSISTALLKMTLDERTHIVPLPTWTLPVRMAQAVLAFVLLIFIAVPTSIWGGFAAFGLGLFTVSLAISTYLAPDLTARSAS
jgi:hypothetical protein